MKRIILMGLLLPTLQLACGVEGSDLDAEIQTRSARSSEALVGILPMLDFSEVAELEVASRVVVDEVVLHVTDLRLLGLDPRIPTGGLRLVEGSRTLRIDRETQDELGFAFPEQLRRDDLAVYLRIGPAPDLDGASVIVRGRFYADVAPDESGRRAHSLLVGPPSGEGAVDPDGEPASPTGKGAVDPDGEPASPSGEGAVDPDGEPASCAPDQVCQGLSAADLAPFISFELRGGDSVELQSRLDDGAALNVVLGIPADRWFTSESVAAMDGAFAPETAAAETAVDRSSARGSGHFVLRDHRMEQLDPNAGTSGADDRLPGGDYSLRSGGGLDPDGTRGW